MLGELAALGAALSWAVSAVLYRKALAKTRPISANIIRLSFTGAILLVLLVVFKFNALTSLSTGIIILACVSGVIGLGLGDTLYMTSLKLVGVSKAVPITCTYPLFSLLWARFLVQEPVTLSVIVGAVTIVFGIWLLTRETNTNDDGKQKKTVLKGMTAALATAVLWSISITMINMAVKEAPNLDTAFAINTLRICAVALLLLISAPLTDRDKQFMKTQKRTVAVLLAGGIVALGVGWFLLTFSFVETLESRAVPISSTTPLFSTLAGVAFLHEKVTAKSVFGSVIIVMGIFLIFMLPNV